MQRKITKILNGFMIWITAAILLLSIGYFIVAKVWSENKQTYMFAAVIFIIANMIVYWIVDAKLDKLLIEKMLKRRQLALANIVGVRMLKNMADSTFRSYRLAELTMDIYLQDGTKISESYVERFDSLQEKITCGTVFITFNESEPHDISLIPSLLISQHVELKDIVMKYESMDEIKIKYLNVEYRRGFMVSSMKEFYEGMKKSL